MFAPPQKQNRGQQAASFGKHSKPGPATHDRHEPPIQKRQTSVLEGAERLPGQSGATLNEGGSRDASAWQSALSFGSIPLFSQSEARTQLMLQPKLMVNSPGDAYEQEADRVSEQVMRMASPAASSAAPAAAQSGPGVQRKCDCGGRCDKCQKESQEHEHAQVQLRASGPSASGMAEAPPIVH